MRRFLLIVFILLLCLACNSKERNETSINGVLAMYEQENVIHNSGEIDTISDPESRVYTLDELKNDFKDSFGIDDIPVGTYFWDEFGEFETQYNLTKDESKFLGKWNIVTFTNGPTYIHYNFFPNKLFISSLSYNRFRVIDSEEMFFNKVLGTWEIVNGVVRLTIYAIITENRTLVYPYNKDVFLVENPYSIDFINIDDIDEQGFTRRPINDTILSEELQQKISIEIPNRTNNLYLRRIYTLDFRNITASGELRKDYDYLEIVPDLAHDNVSGYEVATNPELIRKYIPDWWY